MINENNFSICDFIHQFAEMYSVVILWQLCEYSQSWSSGKIGHARNISICAPVVHWIAFDILHMCGDVFTHSCACTVIHQSLPEIWCPAWCCFLQEEGEQRKSKTGHLQICQGSSSSPPLCPWGGKAPEEAVSLSFYPPFSAPALLCSLGDMCSFKILHFFLHDIESNGISIHLQHLLHTSCKTAEFALCETSFHFFSLHKNYKNTKLPHLLCIIRKRIKM